MSDPNDQAAAGRVPASPARLLTWLDRITTPAFALSLPGFERRRVRLLARLLLSLVFLLFIALIVVLLVDASDRPRMASYAGLIAALAALLAGAFALNRAGHYHIAAGLTVACAVAGPWISLLADPSILRGDLVPLAYVTLTLLLSSMLLPTGVTVALAAAQFGALAVLAMLLPATPPLNWPSLLALVFFAALLSLLSSVVAKHDMQEIDEQAHRLSLSAEQMREQSIRDHLTGLCNRRYLEETLGREIERAAHDGAPLGIVVLDVDNFKHINDAGGHSAGDEVLRELGGMLSEGVRRADVACRYGGDEFVLVLPAASLGVATHRAEELRLRAREMAVAFDGRPLEPVAISLGVAVFPDHGADGASVLGAADEALYRAKMAGRDRVEVARPRTGGADAGVPAHGVLG